MINEDVIKRDVERFRFGRDGRVNSLENLKDSLESKLYIYDRALEKKYFLRLMRIGVKTKFDEHTATCTTENCRKDDGFRDKLFVLDQAIESIDKYYEYEAADTDKLSPEEEVNVHSAINELKQVIKEMSNFNKTSQEVLFNEIDDIKQHFNLGKKNIADLLKGKLITLLERKIIDESIKQFLEEYFFKKGKGLNLLIEHIIST